MSFPEDFSTNLAATAAWATGAAASTWFLNWFSIDSKLTGRWEGSLTCSCPNVPEFRTHVIHCVLVLARPKSRDTSGLLYYTRECTKSDKHLVRGVDELTDYRCSKSNWKDLQFALCFTRQFHKHPNGKLDYNTPRYDFDMNLTGRFSRKPKIHVTTRIPNGPDHNSWVGTFQRI